MSRGTAGAIAVALLLRAGAIFVSDRTVADVARYQKVARHLLDVSWNPYETRRLYPYPPPWAAVEAAAGWAARQGLLPFPVAVKLPVLAADLLVVALLGAAAAAGRASPLAPWLYAVHPVPVLIGGFHGQFDALPLCLLLLALEALARGRRDASALALAGAVATKSFPVLLVPALAAWGASRRQALRYAALACLPVAALLVPFAMADAAALRRELFSYSGIADFGWTGAWRAVEGLAKGVVRRSEAHWWPTAAAASKLLFLCAWAALLVAARRSGWRGEPGRLALAVVLAFLSFYGLLSAQYLLWPVALGLLRPDRHGLAYALAATAALVGFYAFLAPGVLFAAHADAPGPPGWAGPLWAAGATATLGVSLAWLASIVREWRGTRGTP